MPGLHSLRLKDLIEVPLFLILRSCPRLSHLRIGSKLPHVDCTATVGTDKLLPSPFPNIVSLTLEPFFEHLLEENRSLAHFINHAGGRILSLVLVKPVNWYISPDLHFLKSGSGIWANLQYLTFGTELYDEMSTIDSLNLLSTSLLPLASFLQLKTIEIPMNLQFTRQKWVNWFNWIATIVTHANPDLIPASFRAFRFTMLDISFPKTLDSLVHPLNSLQDRFQFCLEFIAPNTAEKEEMETLFEIVRSSFPSWDAACKLHFWIEVYRPGLHDLRWK
ncbi:hypothetical protein DL96DRAFT_1721768 [Flagelloscypha sp. PMI_526]|nr:hypothetical protein DL96DRAFT_1721768 [Flagelloscypha sp. PMI_526]